MARMTDRKLGNEGRDGPSSWMAAGVDQGSKQFLRSAPGCIR